MPSSITTSIILKALSLALIKSLMSTLFALLISFDSI